MLKRAIVFGIAGAALLFLNGCMMWMHGEMSGEHRSEQGTTLVKEVQRGDVKITLEAPPGPEGKPLPLVVQKEVAPVPVADAKAHDGMKSTTMYVIGGAMMVVMMLAMML